MCAAAGGRWCNSQEPWLDAIACVTVPLCCCCSERKDGRTPELRRTFMRGLVRQMGSPAMLAATYSNNTEQVATAAVNELQESLVRSGWDASTQGVNGRQRLCIAYSPVS
jgi:hypothetical protein